MPDDKPNKSENLAGTPGSRSGSGHAFLEDQSLLELAAREAGNLAMQYFNRDPQVWTKGNNSPVTEADIAVDRMLHKRLLSARPDYGWLSEESEDNDERLSKKRVFVVDPIDGTRAFIDGGSEWTISLAVVENQRPVAAALFAPVRGEMYLASKYGGATLNGEALTCPVVANLNGARAAGPRPAIDKGPLALAGVQSYGFVRSLAYRLVMITTGELDIALAREASNDWDLAAADLIIEESDGLLRDKSDDILKYNRAGTSHDSLYAACRPLGAQIAPLMAALKFPKRH